MLYHYEQYCCTVILNYQIYIVHYKWFNRFYLPHPPPPTRLEESPSPPHLPVGSSLTCVDRTLGTQADHRLNSAHCSAELGSQQFCTATPREATTRHFFNTKKVASRCQNVVLHRSGNATGDYLWS